MKICVLGAGVIGVTTAYALARLGHDVTVIDEGSDVAMGASHANGAQLSYSYVSPFASPTILKKLPGYLLGLDPAVRLGISLRADYLSWGIKFLSQCTRTNFAKNLSARIELAVLSRETLAIYEDEIQSSAFKRTGHGKLVIAQSKSELAALKKAAMQDANQKLLTPNECLEVEPSLKTWSRPLLGGQYLKDDHALDPVLYCKALRRAAEQKYGVKFCFGEKIIRVETGCDAVKTIVTDNRNYECSATVVCLGNGIQHLLSPLGIKVPIYPMQGYSLTLQATKTSPTTSVTDLKNKIVYANLGTSIRIAGFMDANQPLSKAKQRGQQLLKMARLTWPDAANFDGPVEHWTHFRPMVPSGIPIIGASILEGLYINAGHGSLGYTFAAGSAKKIAEEIGHAHSNIEASQSEKTYA